MAPVDNPFNVDQQLKKLAESALAHTSGNRTAAADLLGISVRTLRNWIHKFDLAKEYPAKRTVRK